MPFPSFQPNDRSSPGDPGRSPPSSFSSSTFAHSPYSSQSQRQPPSFAGPSPATILPCPARHPLKPLPAVFDLRVAATLPLMSLPTTPYSDFSQQSKNPNESNSTTTGHDESSTFQTPAEAKNPVSVLHALTPDALQAFRESHIDEADNPRFEYDGFAERMIVKCKAGPVHDSLAIFFIRAVTDGIREGGGRERDLQVCTSTEFHNFKGEYEDTNSRKAPAAYVKLGGVRGFPILVAEVGWAEEMDDLMDDVRLWLLGTDRQTKIVIVVKFTEHPRAAYSDSPAPSSASSAADADADANTDTDTDTHIDADPDEPTEEDQLIASINESTRLGDLTEALLDLDYREALAQPLIGTLAATFHVFRLDETDTIVEDFVATVLPAPALEEPDRRYYLDLGTLDLGTLYFERYPWLHEMYTLYIPILFDMAELREDIANQVPDMEGKRAADRALALLKERGLWNGPKTFAGAKKEKRKRGEDGGDDSDEGNKGKRAR